jgi:hypothetical protein
LREQLPQVGHERAADFIDIRPFSFQRYLQFLNTLHERRGMMEPPGFSAPIKAYGCLAAFPHGEGRAQLRPLLFQDGFQTLDATTQRHRLILPSRGGRSQ